MDKHAYAAELKAGDFYEWGDSLRKVSSACRRDGKVVVAYSTLTELGEAYDVQEFLPLDLVRTLL